MDLGGGFLIAGAVAAWIPNTFWSAFFLTGHPLLAEIWGPLIGPVISMLSFVCSIGNVPLAAVLWGSGISFGGVISFIFADLLIPPILAPASLDTAFKRGRTPHPLVRDRHVPVVDASAKSPYPVRSTPQDAQDGHNGRCGRPLRGLRPHPTSAHARRVLKQLPALQRLDQAEVPSATAALRY